MRRMLGLMATMATLVGASSCGSSNDTSGGNASKSGSNGPAGTLTLGFVGTLSGDVAMNGQLSSRGARLAVDQINAKGGVSWHGKRYLLKLAEADDEGTPVAGVKGVSRLISHDDALAILGPEFAQVVVPTLGVTARDKVVQLYSTNSSLGPQANTPYAFRVRVDDTRIAAAMTDYIAGLPGSHRVGISLLNNAYGQSGKALMSSDLAKRGIPVVATASHDFGDRDLTPNATAMIRGHADVVISWTGPVESIALLRSLRGLGWKGTFLHVNPDSIYATIGKSAVNGVVGPQGWPPTDPSQLSREFLSAYRATFHQTPDEHSAAYYDAVRLLASAIRAVGPDSSKIKDYIGRLGDWRGVQGTFRPAELPGPNLLTAVSLVKVENGRLTLLRQYK